MGIGVARGLALVPLVAFSHWLHTRTLMWLPQLVHPLVCKAIDCNVPFPCSNSGTVPSNVSEGLEVILPSVGQTGTTSVHEALLDLGLKSYHVEERTLYRVLMHDGISAQEAGLHISGCGMQAVSLEPATDMFPVVLEASPNAKVILTWRPYPKWYVSTTTGGVTKDKWWAAITQPLHLPWYYWRYLMPLVLDHFSGNLRTVFQRGDTFGSKGKGTASMLIHRQVSSGLYAPPGSNIYDRGVFKVSAQEEAYLGHINEIRKLAEGRLLEFDISKHGYAEIANFIGRTPPPGNPRIPHTRSKNSWTNDSILANNPEVWQLTVFAMLLCQVAGALLHYRLVYLGFALVKRICTGSKEEAESS